MGKILFTSNCPFVLYFCGTETLRRKMTTFQYVIAFNQLISLYVALYYVCIILCYYIVYYIVFSPFYVHCAANVWSNPMTIKSYHHFEEIYIFRWFPS